MKKLLKVQGKIPGGRRKEMQSYYTIQLGGEYYLHRYNSGHTLLI